MMNPILEFQNVACMSDSHVLADVQGVTFQAFPSTLILVLLESHSDQIPLFDLAEGLREADVGVVKFQGERWEDMAFFRQSEMRGRIGRVFETEAWISNLSVYENMALSERYHTLRSETDIREEADCLARAVGLDGAPEGRVEHVRKSELRKAEWARAFLGNPALALLAQPESGADPESVALLIDLIDMTLERGAAVVWTTSDKALWKDKKLDGCLRYRMQEDRMISATEVE